MTTTENISIAGNGFTELNQPIAALRLGNFAINLNGTLTLTADSRVVVETTGPATVNGVIQETGGARAFEKAGAGTLNLTAANTPRPWAFRPCTSSSPTRFVAPMTLEGFTALSVEIEMNLSIPK